MGVKLCLQWLRMLLPAAIICIGIGFSACHAPSGGRLLPADFENGFEVFVLEGNAGDALAENIQHIADAQAKAEIYEICTQITCYREINGAEDIMLGEIPEDARISAVFFACGACVYKIEIIHWENHAGDAWAGWPIRNELYGEPLLCVWRIARTEELDADPLPGNIVTYSGRDSFNSEAGRGWYATLPQEEMDSLCAILSAEGGISLQ